MTIFNSIKQMWRDIFAPQAEQEPASHAYINSLVADLCRANPHKRESIESAGRACKARLFCETVLLSDCIIAIEEAAK
jgi:hypothetical protein